MLAQTSTMRKQSRKKYLRGIWIFSEIDQYERKCICKKTHLNRLYKSTDTTVRQDFATDHIHMRSHFF